MKKFILAAALALVVGAVAAQERSAPPPDSEEGRALQERLKERAQRIPARGLAAALRAAREGRAARARVVAGGPDLAALRAALESTEREDAAQQRAPLQSLAAGPGARRGPPSPPSPGLRTLDPENLPRVAQAEVDRVLIPVLLPAHPDVRDKIRVYGQQNAYTATAQIDAEANLSISGTCHRVIGGDPDIVAFRKRLAENPPRLPGTNAEYHISRNDFGVDISFAKFGCGYVMTIECGNPAEDERCAQDDYIVGLADSMILANPALAGGE